MRAPLFAIQVFLLLAPLIAASQTPELLNLPCNESELETFCAKLETLSTADAIQYGDGNIVPGCALSSIARKEKHAYLRKMALRRSQIPAESLETDSEYVRLRQSFPDNREEDWTRLVEFTPNAIQRVQTLFKLVVKEAQDLIVNGRSKKALSAEEAGILTRLQFIGLTFQPTSGGRFACAPGWSATYDQETHEVKIPHGHFHLPDESLIRMMAHEVAHSFDSCSASRALYTGDPKLRPFKGAYFDPQNSKYSLSGWVTAWTEKISPAIPFAAHPFAEVYTCLSQPDGGNFMKYRNRDGDSCMQDVPDEVFADWFASQIMNRMNEKKRLTPKSPASLPALKFATNVPRFKISTGSAALFYQAQAACGELHWTSANELTHPSLKRRYLDIMLKQPSLAAATGCRPTGKACPLPSAK